MIGRPSLDGIRMKHRLADIAQPLIQRMRQEVHCRRLPISRDYKTTAAVLLQIFAYCGDPFCLFVRDRLSPGVGRAELGGEGAGELLNLVSP